MKKPLATWQGRTTVRPFFVSGFWFPHMFVIASNDATVLSNGTVAPVPVLNTDNSKAGTEKETKHEDDYKIRRNCGAHQRACAGCGCAE